MRSNVRWTASGTSIIAVLAALAASPATSSAPQAAATPPPCLAYILSGDIWLTCNGRKQQVTTDGNVTDFAISADTLAWEGRDGDIQSFPLSGAAGPHLDPRAGPSRLYASCGTILHVRYSYGESGTGTAVAVLEVPGGRALAFGSYLDFRCSSDRKVIFGLTSRGENLSMGLPPAGVWGPHHDYPHFDVSPNGRYIAFGGPSQVCVQPTDGFCLCIGDEDFGGISVSDDGSVLYTGHWDEHTCSYKDAWHASLQPRPGYAEGDLCQAVAMWRPGLRQPEILVPLARQPQWISAKTAERLAVWRQAPARP